METVRQIWPNLFNLYLYPRAFWANPMCCQNSFVLLLTIWCCGIKYTLARINIQIMQAELRIANGSSASGPLMMIGQSWPTFWAILLIIGAIAGLSLWWIGGWWYRVRIDLACDSAPSGAAHRQLARTVYAYSGFIASVSTIAGLLINTLVYPNYQAAYAADDSIFAAISLSFFLRALWVSYIGVITLFPVNLWRARIWFLILPLMIYGVGAILLVGSQTQ